MSPRPMSYSLFVLMNLLVLIFCVTFLITVTKHLIEITYGSNDFYFASVLKYISPPLWGRHSSGNRSDQSLAEEVCDLAYSYIGGS